MRLTSIQCHCCGAMSGNMLALNVASRQVFRCVQCDRAIRRFLNATDDVDGSLLNAAKVAGLLAGIGYIKQFDDIEWTLELDYYEETGPLQLKTFNYTENPQQQFKRNPAYERAKRKQEREASLTKLREML